MSAYDMIIDTGALTSAVGFAITGRGYEQFGTSIAFGDVNKDGRGDFIVSSLWGGSDGRGSVDIVYGIVGSWGSGLELASAPENAGYRLTGLSPEPLFGVEVAFLGDTNGDRVGDFGVGSSYADYTTLGPRAGDSLVVRGQPDRSGDFKPEDFIPTQGFILNGNAWDNPNGQEEGDGLGSAVSSAGDINGDGLSDIVVGAYRTDLGDGAAYVIFGSRAIPAVSLTTFAGANGFRIFHSDPFSPGVSSQLGHSVAAGGDINGDGIDDLIVAAGGARLDDETEAGTAYIIFGREAFGPEFDLSTLNGSNGFRIDGIAHLDALGSSIASAGDVNADGYDDIIVGAFLTDPAAVVNAGSAYVIFGGESPAPILSVSELDGTNGFAISGVLGWQGVGYKVSSAGDWNGDGFDDVLISDRGDACYVVFGKAGGFSANLNMTDLDGSNGFQVLGPPGFEDGFYIGPLFGGAVTSGDVDGDGLSDLIIGAPQAAPNGTKDTSGKVFVIYGQLPAEAVVRTGSGIGQTIQGGAFSDTLKGLGGADKLIGNAGHDLLDGGRDADTMSGGLGNDRYIVDNTSDKVIESSKFGGTDSVSSSVSFTLGANVENLTLTGAATNGTGNWQANVITGNAAANTLSGSRGDDTLRGGGGNDRLVGGDGRDLLDGGTGIDLMVGSAGDDTYIVDNGRDRAVETVGGGIDTVRASVSFALGAQIEKLVLTGNAASGTGNGLANSITGNSAANLLDGRGGADRMQGWGGNDTYMVDHRQDEVVEASKTGGTDRVFSTVSFSLAPNVENLLLAGTAAIDGTGNWLANLITGNPAANALDGSRGNDTLRGGGGNDRLVGGDGRDMLDGGTGIDLMTGSGGDDTYIVDNGRDRVVETAGGGIDTVRASVSFTLGSQVENLLLTGTAANGTGNGLANLLIGNGSANLLRGGAGNDDLRGGEGADALHGGSGSDRMKGGAGADKFLFEAPLDPSTNVDRIADFTHGTDKILLDNAIFAGLASGALPLGSLAIGTTASEARDRIIYDPATGALYFDRDGTGAAAPIKFAVLDNRPADLTASDFIVI